MVVIIIDFVVLWSLLYWVIAFIPKSDEWDDDKHRIFWVVCTQTMMLSEHWFYSFIHERLVGASDILRRSFLLVAAQTVLSYLVLRTVHFTYHLGWQMFLMGVCMLAVIILARFVERWMLKRLRKSGYNMRKVTFVGADEELQQLHRKLMSNPTYGYKLYCSYMSVKTLPSSSVTPIIFFWATNYICSVRAAQ